MLPEEGGVRPPGDAVVELLHEALDGPLVGLPLRGAVGQHDGDAGQDVVLDEEVDGDVAGDALQGVVGGGDPVGQVDGVVGVVGAAEVKHCHCVVH